MLVAFQIVDGSVGLDLMQVVAYEVCPWLGHNHQIVDAVAGSNALDDAQSYTIGAKRFVSLAQNVGDAVKEVGLVREARLGRHLRFIRKRLNALTVRTVRLGAANWTLGLARSSYRCGMRHCVGSRCGTTQTVPLS